MGGRVRRNRASCRGVKVGTRISVDVELSGMDDFINEVGKSPHMKRIIEEIANSVAAEARLIAPYDTGDYERSIHVEMESTPHRYVGKVVADDWKSGILEANYGVLAKALRKGKKL